MWNGQRLFEYLKIEPKSTLQISQVKFRLIAFFDLSSNPLHPLSVVVQAVKAQDRTKW